MAAPDIGSRPCCRSLFCALDLGAADSGAAAGSDFATVGDGGAALGVAGFFDLSAVGAAGSKRKGFDRHNDQLALPSATNVGSCLLYTSRRTADAVATALAAVSRSGKSGLYSNTCLLYTSRCV